MAKRTRRARSAETDELLDLLRCVGHVTSRRMFGGTGFYLEGVFFALEMEGRLFFHVDDATRPEYVALGSEPFRPFADKASRTYFEVPERVLADRDALRAWAEKAVAAARAKTRSKPRKRPSPRKK